METQQQQLGKRNTFTPLDTSHIQGIVATSLNRDENLSERGLKTFPNNLEENQQSGKTGQDLRIPVLNMRGKPLMPATPRKARHLLKQGKAKVVKRTPFVIQLLTATGKTKQDMTLGIDAGYSHVGFSVTTEKNELMSGELTLRNDISKLLEQRRNYRRTRRGRLWYRKPRFLNRAKTKGWLAPSIQHKLDSHIRLIEKLKIWLPITKTIIEIAQFDMQKMQNPEISGIEYQQGELMGYEVRAYLLEKFNWTCAYCGKKDVPLEIEHIVPKSRGGSDCVSNLTISCKKCNQKKGAMTAEEFGFPDIQKQAQKPLKAATFMNLVKQRIAETLGCDTTFGYITKHDRIKLGLEKSHANDAFVIARGTNQTRCKSYKCTQTRRNNRSIQTNRKGFKPSIRRQRYKLQPNDLVRFKGLCCRVKGMFSYGRQVKLVDDLRNMINANIKKVRVICYGKGIQFA